MRLSYSVTFDPESISPKTVKDALLTAGLSEGDIKLQRKAEAASKPKAPKSSRPGPPA